MGKEASRPAHSFLREGLGDANAFSGYHPLVTFAYFAAVVVFTMFSMHPAFLTASLLGSMAYALLLCGTRYFKVVGLLCFPIVLFTTGINPLLNHRGITVLFYLNGNAVTMEAVLYGLASSVMLISALMWFGSFNKVVTGDKFVYLFGRFLPALSLILSMCMRYVPLLKNRFREISDGQKCMGRRYGLRHPLKKLRQLTREFSILIAWTLETSIETSDSMEARGYGLHGRTSYHRFHFRKQDAGALALIVLLAAIVVAGWAAGMNTIYYYPGIEFPYEGAAVAPVLIAYCLLLLLPVIVDVGGEWKWKKLRSKI